MSDVKPYTDDPAWIELQEKLADHKKWLHTQAIMRTEFAPVNVGAVRDLVEALEVLARIGIEVESELAARDAEIAELREQYADAIRALRKQLADAGECASCVGWRDGSHEPGCPTGTILSTPRARAILGTSDATHTAEGR